MSREVTIYVQPLSATKVGLYGSLVARDEKKEADISGEGWRCWFPIGRLQFTSPQLVGIVRSEPQPLAVKAMERHKERSEWVYALDEQLIQTVALSAAQNPDQPDPEQTTAFLLKPGQGILIRAGVWHAPGLPADRDPVFYGFVLGEAPPTEPNEGWVPFVDQAMVRIIREG